MLFEEKDKIFDIVFGIGEDSKIYKVMNEVYDEL